MDCLFPSVSLTSLYSGAGGSEGRTSWTAKPELADYISFYGFMLQFLRELKSITQRLLSNSDGARDSITEDRNIHLILGGYSYGSLIASHVPPLNDMLDLFPPGASAEMLVDEISKIGRRVAAKSMPDLQTVESGTGPDGPGFSTAIMVSHLLVSPLLPPISQLLTAFSTLSMSVRGGGSAPIRPTTRPADQLCMHRTLALFGNKDTFTSVRKLQRWSAELSSMPHSQFRGCEIEAAGHFWREKGVEKHARQALREWLGRDSS